MRKEIEDLLSEAADGADILATQFEEFLGRVGRAVSENVDLFVAAAAIGGVLWMLTL